MHVNKHKTRKANRSQPAPRSAPTPQRRAIPPRVVLIGGSLGALEPLEEILFRLPMGFPVPILIVSHRLEGEPSDLVEVLQSHSSMPVGEPNDKQALEAGHVYLAPTDYHLLIEADGTLAFSVDEPINYSRPSIDELFESAAAAFGAATMGVLLSGANNDGAAGIAAIHRRGGMTVVQEPKSATATAMIEAAIKTGAVEHVLAPQRIADRILAECVGEEPS